MNTFISAQIAVVTNTLDSLKRKDTLTVEDKRKINNTLASALKSIEAKMVDYNKRFIDTKELQSEINKLKMLY